MRSEKMTKTMWILCEAFTLTCDDFNHQTIHESLTAWAGVYPTRKACMDALQRYVRERVREDYEGLDGEGYDIAAVVADIITGHTGDDECSRYNYSTDDREVVWRMYPVKVIV